jgi:hypothetical protein
MLIIRYELVKVASFLLPCSYQPATGSYPEPDSCVGHDTESVQFRGPT